LVPILLFHAHAKDRHFSPFFNLRYTLNDLRTCHRNAGTESSNTEAARWSVERTERFEGDTISAVLTQGLGDGRMLAMTFAGLDSDFREGLTLGRELTFEHKAPTVQMSTSVLLRNRYRKDTLS